MSTTTIEPAPEIIALIVDERRRLLENQVSFADTLRNRMTAMLSVASIVAALFGANLVPGSHPRRVEITLAIALALFGLSAIVTVTNMTLRKMKVGVETDEPLTLAWTDPTVTLAGMNNTMALRYQEQYEANESTMKWMNRLYDWTCVLVGLQVVAWGLAAFKL